MITQQTQHVKSMLFYRWSTVYNAGPTVNQHRFNALCLLGSSIYYLYSPSIYYCHLGMKEPLQLQLLQMKENSLLFKELLENSGSFNNHTDSLACLISAIQENHEFPEEPQQVADTKHEDIPVSKLKLLR